MKDILMSLGALGIMAVIVLVSVYGITYSIVLARKRAGK